jgi:HSP20 family molecular chaperone IbpA
MVWKRKCPSCGKKIDKKFSYCPWCGAGFRQKKEEDDFGMLGKDDEVEEIPNQMKMPFGLDKVMNSLIRQLEKQMDSGSGEGMPGGFRIQISTGKPRVRELISNQKSSERKISQKPAERIPISEIRRREKLQKVNANSNVRRLGDKIIYELFVPGVKDKKDVSIARLEQGIEIKAYSKDKCYVKVIPLKVEIIGCYVKDDVLFVEMKG